MKPRSIIIHALSILGLAALAGSAQARDVYSAGHADIGVGYEDDSLHLHQHFGADSVVNGAPLGGTGEGEEYEYELADVLTYVPLSTAASVGATPYNSAFGLPPGGGTLYVLPQNNQPGLPFLGFGLEELDAADWIGGTLTMHLDGVTGPGNYSVWSSGSFGALTFVFSSNDPSATTGNNSAALPAGTHSHFNMGFTQPGLYEVTFTVAGEHVTDGLKSDTNTVTFGVGTTTTPVPEPGAYGVLLGGLLFAVVMFRRRRARSRA